MGKSAAEQIKNTKMVAHLLRKNLELVMALTLTERVLAVKIMIIKLVLISTVVLIMMRIMIKVRTLELVLSWVINHYHLQVEPNPKKNVQ